MPKAKVAILRTSPGTVLRDYHTLLNLAGYQDVIARDADVISTLAAPDAHANPVELDLQPQRIARHNRPLEAHIV